MLYLTFLLSWQGVKIYDSVSQTRITYIDRPTDSPRADLFKCSLHWQDDSTLLVAWADFIKVARVRARPRQNNDASTANLPPLLVEITAVFQLDCMVAGIVPHPTPIPSPDGVLLPLSSKYNGTKPSLTSPTPIPITATLTSFLVVAYIPPETFVDELTDDRARQARKAAERPELRIISRAGEELTADALSITNYQHWSCNDYVLVGVSSDDQQPLDVDKERCYVVMSPKDLVLVKPRDRRDHVMWLVERRRYEEALEEVERAEAEASGNPKEEEEDELVVQDIRRKYIHHLVDEGWLPAFPLLTERIHHADDMLFRQFCKSGESMFQVLCSRFETLGSLDIRL